MSGACAKTLVFYHTQQNNKAQYEKKVFTLHHSISSPLADENATPEYAYRSTIRVIPLCNLDSMSDLQKMSRIKYSSSLYKTTTKSC